MVTFDHDSSTTSIPCSSSLPILSSSTATSTSSALNYSAHYPKTPPRSLTLDPTHLTDATSPPLTPTRTPSSTNPSPNSTSLISPSTSLNLNLNTILSPPTPAASPTPYHEQHSRFGVATTRTYDDDHDHAEILSPSELTDDWLNNAKGTTYQRTPTIKNKATPSTTDATDSMTDQQWLDAVKLQFHSRSISTRKRLLESLISECPPSTLSPLLHLIQPRLKRDFLKTLPLELAFHVLSFVDEVKTLARASQVSRFWRALLEDENTWKRMCWSSGFGSSEIASSTSSSTNKTAYSRLRGLEFGERETEEGTPAGRERRGTLDRESLAAFAARAESFELRSATASRQPRLSDAWQTAVDLPNNHYSHHSSDGDLGAGLGIGSSTFVDLPSIHGSTLSRDHSTSRFDRYNTGTRTDTDSLISPPLHSLSILDPLEDEHHLESEPILSSHEEKPFSNANSTSSEEPFSFKSHFKRAWLCQSSWLHGPGRLISTQQSAESEGIVTCLGFDSEWIIVGMATSKVHVFDAKTGVYVKSLGHELGIWCLTLVSKGGGPNKSVGTPQTFAARKAGTGKGKHAPTRSRDDWSLPNVSNLATSYSQPGIHRRESHATFEDFMTPQPPSSSASPRPAPSTRRRRSFHSFSERNSPDSSSTSAFDSSRTGGMGLGAGGETGDSSHQASACGTAKGYGQTGAVVVTGGCDRDVRVWDVQTGTCKYVMRGHTSTIRCIRVIDGRPIAISGSRDSNIRVWNIEMGTMMHLLSGHTHSVRCIEVHGNKVVSGSYDTTCRLWDVDTGECLFVFRGHVHQIYAVAFDGEQVVTGSLDSTVRVWSATTGSFLALLQGHTSLVSTMQLDPITKILVTGGSDGRVIVFDLHDFRALHRLCAADNSLTSLQFDSRFIVTGGNDGHIRLWDFKTGHFIRELSTDTAESVWKVAIRDDVAVTLRRKEGRTILEVRTFRPPL